MRTDVAGRVKNTSLAASKPLLPLYEAVVNSVQAIQDAPKQSKGRITIRILRDNEHLLSEQDAGFGDIIGFEVIDTVLVLTTTIIAHSRRQTRPTKRNAEARALAASSGSSRLSALKSRAASNRTEVFAAVSLSFAPEGDGVRNMTIADSPENTSLTTVRLTGFRSKYQQQCPKKLETIATHLIEHCLEYFIRSDCPELVLTDTSTSTSLNLNDQFAHEMAGQSTRDTVKVDDHVFYVLHVRLYRRTSTTTNYTSARTAAL